VRSPATGVVCLTLDADFPFPIDELAPVVSGIQNAGFTPLVVIASPQACNQTGPLDEIGVFTYYLPATGGPVPWDLPFTLVVP
jgi:hypothetical protein